MKREDLRKILLDSAFFVMACDGEIHEDELRVIRELNERTSYFEGLDLDARIEVLTVELKSNSRRACQTYFSLLREGDLDSVQQLMVVEVLLRVTYADLRLDDNEILFLKTAVKALGLEAEHLKQRFGLIDGFIEGGAASKSSHPEDGPVPKEKYMEGEPQSFPVPEFKDIGKAMALLKERLEGEEGE